MKEHNFCAWCDELIESHDTMFMDGDLAYICEAQITIEQKRESLKKWLDKRFNENRNADKTESL